MTARMKAGAAMLALIAGGAQAQDLKFAPGEDARFNWDSFEAFGAEHDLSGQSLKIDGPWGGVDKALFESVIAYFEAAPDRPRGWPSFRSPALPPIWPHAGSLRRCRPKPPTGCVKTMPPASPGSILRPIRARMGKRRFMAFSTRSM